MEEGFPISCFAWLLLSLLSAKSAVEGQSSYRRGTL